MWVVAYVDDCDIAAEDPRDAQLFFETVNKEWKSKIVDAEFMLGTRRTRRTENGITKIHLSMAASNQP